MKAYYIYVLENDAGHIKVGITQNFEQRLASLQGSNGGGNQITRYYVSDPTWLYSIEKTIHNHFHSYRIQGTEWFKGIFYEEVVEYVKSCFQSKSYPQLNALRYQYLCAHESENHIKQGEQNQDDEELVFV